MSKDKALEQSVATNDTSNNRVDETATQRHEPEPVAVWELQETGWETICDADWLMTLPVGTRLYTYPPKREPLTDEEIADLWSAQIFHITDLKIAKDFVRDIEAAHGIKGEA